MFWNKEILEEKKEETLENRIIDLINLNSSKVDIGYNRYWNELSPNKTSYQEAWIVKIQANSKQFNLGYMEDWNDKASFFLFEDDNSANDVALDITMRNAIKNSAEERIKRDFIKKLFPIDPEITKMMSDVEEIQDSKEQVDYILKRIQ